MATTGGPIEMLDPTLEPVVAQSGLSPRLDTLNGKTLGVIWNGRVMGDQIINQVLDLLREKYEIKEVVFRDKPYVGNIAPAEILEELRGRCDAVIAGVGD